MQPRFTPENITELKMNEIMVFGSNTAGIHGAGAARLAFEKFGAKWGIGEGLHGQTYALPTKDKSIRTLSLDDISVHIEEFIECVLDNRKKVFLLTKIGMGLAGYQLEDIAPLFMAYAPLPTNLVIPKEFADFFKSYGN